MNKFKFRSKKISWAANGLFTAFTFLIYKIEKLLGRRQSIEDWLRSQSKEVSEFSVISVFDLKNGLIVSVGAYFDGVQKQGFFCQSHSGTLTHKRMLIPYNVSISAQKLFKFSSESGLDSIDFIVQSSELYRGFQ